MTPNKRTKWVNQSLCEGEHLSRFVPEFPESERFELTQPKLFGDQCRHSYCSWQEAERKGWQKVVEIDLAKRTMINPPNVTRFILLAALFLGSLSAHAWPKHEPKPDATEAECRSQGKAFVKPVVRKDGIKVRAHCRKKRKSLQES